MIGRIAGTISALLLIAGCGESGSDYDAALADAYTEVLIVEIQHPSDSAAWLAALDERLAENRYRSAEDVREAIHRLAEEDAAGFKRLLDSVYIRLDSVQKGTRE